MLPRTVDLLMLRRLTTRDLDDFQAYRADPRLGHYQGWSPMPEIEALDFLHDVESAPLLQPGHWSQIAISSAETDRLLGDIGILVCKDSSQAEIGFTLARPNQGRGLATRAVIAAIGLVFEHTTVRRVIAVTDVRNVQSIRLLERIGMTLEGTSEAIFRGQPCSEHTYVMPRHQSDA